MSEIDASVLAWVFIPELWFALAIVLIIADMVIGMNFIVLPVGISALVLAGLLWIQGRELFEFFENWRQIAIFFSILSVLSIGIVKRVFQRVREANKDINDY